MQEESDALAAAERAQFVGERYEVVVVHPDHVVGAQQRGQLAREQAVDTLVAGKEAGREVGQVEPIVQGRPQRLVGIASVVAIVVGLREVDGRQLRVARALVVHFAFTGCTAFDDLTAPAEPQPTAASQRLAHRDRQAAGRRLLRVSYAVRNDDEAGGFGRHREPVICASPTAPRGASPR